MTSLSDPFSIEKRGITLKNRMVMGSMHTGLEDRKKNFKRLRRFYEERIKADVAMIITGGFSPNFRGRLHPLASEFSNLFHMQAHKEITKATQGSDAKIILQILHAGRYAYHPFAVSASKTKSPISPFKAQELSLKGIQKTIEQYKRSAYLAMKAGYHGVEIMGSEGYFINQFLSPHTNHRKDAYGQSFEGRSKLALEITKAIRQEIDGLLLFRLSLMDLVANSQSFDEVISLAMRLKEEGVDIIDSGIGQHESRVPTIATTVTPLAFSEATKIVRQKTGMPFMATNRINTAELAQKVLDDDLADLISSARPYLADPAFAAKAVNTNNSPINICIACNQACLDHTFQNKVASCIVNPRACHEDRYPYVKVKNKKKIAVIGSGVAGMAFSLEAAKRGHQVTLYEKNAFLGGQFHLASLVSGKDDYAKNIEYFKEELQTHDVDIKLNHQILTSELEEILKTHDDLVFATGVKPRIPSLARDQFIKDLKMIDYQQVFEPDFKDWILAQDRPLKIGIMGAGGIGHDVAITLSEYLQEKLNKKPNFFQAWGIQDAHAQKPFELDNPFDLSITPHKIYLMQRSPGAIGKDLGKTTGWIIRQKLKKFGVNRLSGVEYHRIKNEGLDITYLNERTTLQLDCLIFCSGQIEENALFKLAENMGHGDRIHLIGGAHQARGLDAKFSIQEAIDLAYGQF